MFILQFHKKDPLFRLVDMAIFDGYAFGDRFLEGAEFRITLGPNREPVVTATEPTVDYLTGVKSSTEGWEQEIQKRLLAGYDNLYLPEDRTSPWDNQELHLVRDYDSYLSDGLTLVANED